MIREIYEVQAKIVDANGAFNQLSGYPKTFDSRSYSNDTEKTRQRAYGEYHEALGAMCKRDDRQLQLAMIVRINDGLVIESTAIGEIAEESEAEE